MNKIIKTLLILLIAASSELLAFEDSFSRKIDFGSYLNDLKNNYFLSGNPASMIYEKNIEIFSAQTALTDNSYKRTFDPSTMQNIGAFFSTIRKINETSFFLAGISYDDLRLRGMFGSREKDFYDDYFSTIDSSTTDAGYY